MKTQAIAEKLISSLSRQKMRAECPCCNRDIDLDDAGLFFQEDFTPSALKLVEAWRANIKMRTENLREWKKKISTTSFTTSKSVNIGFVLEKLTPALSTFKFDRNDCRTIGDPLDLVIFDGLSKRGQVDRIIFADVKTGKARLSDRQKSIRQAVETKRVEMDLYAP